MLINLSNHPSGEWDAIQKKAALYYGDILDLPFPQIPPEWDTDKVQVLACSYLEKCFNLLGEPSPECAVHVAGEPVFCFFLINSLLISGYTVLASTTQRKVIREGEKKISEFRFVRFRKYKL